MMFVQGGHLFEDGHSVAFYSEGEAPYGHGPYNIIELAERARAMHPLFAQSAWIDAAIPNVPKGFSPEWIIKSERPAGLRAWWTNFKRIMRKL